MPSSMRWCGSIWIGQDLEETVISCKNGIEENVISGNYPEEAWSGDSAPDTWMLRKGAYFFAWKEVREWQI